MSTDDTSPVRPPGSGEPSGYAQAEARPSFQPSPRPGARPSPPSPAQPSYQRPGYSDSAYPDTVRIGQQPSPPAWGASDPADDPGWSPRPGGPGGPDGYGPGGQYGRPGGGYGADQQGTAPYGSPQAGYGGPSGGDGSGPPTRRGRTRRRRSRRRRVTVTLFIVLVVLILLVIADRVSVKIAENEIADQITSADTQIHPSVSIPGFPFLTQIATRDIHEIDISASNVAAGPVTITSVNAVAKGVHINGSFNGGKVDTITATVFVGFSSLSTALTSQSQGIANLSLSSAGNGEVKASFGILGANLLTETGKITLSGNKVTVTWISGGSGSGGSDGGLGGLIGGLTGSGSGSGVSLPNLSFTIPKLPAGVQIKTFTVGAQGITIIGGAQNTTLSQ